MSAFLQFIALVAGSIALQLLIPKPKQNVDRTKAPDAPSVGSDIALPIVYGRARIGGTLIYTAKLKYIPARKRSGKGAPRQDTPDGYEAPLLGYAIAAINPVDLVRIELNGEIFYDAETNDSKLKTKSASNLANHIKFQTGASTQVVEPLLIAAEGTSNLPRFKKTSMLWLRNINLNDFGNSYPTCQVIVKSSQNYPSIGALLKGVIEYSKVNIKAQADFGFPIIAVAARLNKLPFYGASFMLDGSNPISWIQTIVESWNLASRSYYGRVTIDTAVPFDQPTYDRAEIDINRNLGIDGNFSFEVKTAGEDKAPTQIALSYIDIDLESTPQVAYASLGRAEYENAVNFDIKTILPLQLANTLAERMLRNAWVKNKTITFTLPITALDAIQPGKIVSLKGNEAIENIEWQIVSASLGEKGFVEYSGFEFCALQYSFSANNASNLGQDSFINPQGDINSAILKILDIPPLKDEDSRLAPYFALDKGSYSGRVFLYLSTNNINYDYIETLSLDTPIAYLDTSSPSLDANVPYEFTTIDVTFNSADTSLVSVGKKAWLRGDQLFVYQNCIYSYKTAVFVGSASFNRWRITGLIAGFRGTGANVAQLSTLNSDRDVVFIKGYNQTPREFTSTIPNTYFDGYYSRIAESSFDDISNNITDNFGYIHNKASAAAVQLLPAKTFNTGVIQLRWVARSSEDNALTLMDEVPQPIYNSNGGTFVIRIYNAAGSIVRTTSVSNTYRYNYSVANQIADGNLNIVDLEYTVSQQSNRDLLGYSSKVPYDFQQL